jgi:uncharacterized protein (DUF1778 family)
MDNQDKSDLTADEIDMMMRQPVIIPAERWDDFLDWLERPPEFKPKIHALMNSKAPWERSEVPAKD